MSEEKDLNEIEKEEISSDDGFGDLSSFVDLDDLENLEGMGDLSGLGDVSDLGDLSDLEFFDDENLNKPEAVDMPDVDIPDINIPDFNVSDTDISANASDSDIPAYDVSDTDMSDSIGEIPDISDLMSDIPADGMSLDDMEVPEMSDIASDMSAYGISPDDISLDDVSLDDISLDDIEVPDISDMDSEISLDNISDNISLDDTKVSDIPDISADVPPNDIGIEDMPDVDSDVSLDDMTVPDAEAVGDVMPPDNLSEDIPKDNGGGDGSLDSMLDGLLDNLDMTGSVSDSSVNNAPEADMGNESQDGLDDLMNMLGTGEEAALDDKISADAFDSLDGMADVSELLPENKSVEEVKKPGFFKRIFGNVVTDEIAEAERKAKEDEEEQAAVRAEEEAKEKEEKAAKKAEAAEAKAAKKAEKDALKAKKAEEKAAKKAEKEAKKEEEKAAQEQEVVGKLNKAGVTIVVICAALILAGVILGTNVFGYKITISEAERYFNLQKYADAYEEILGTDVKEKDPDTYNKIIIVMKVQQSLNSYSNYANMKYYPDALNALLRGLQKYDENIDDAMDLEIEGDLEVCKDKILSILRDEFGLSESEAYDILSLDAEAYSEKVVSVAMKKN